MAFEEKITQPSQGLTGSLSGEILVDEGRGALVISENGQDVIVLSRQGLDFFNNAQLNDIRLGTMPDGGRYMLMMKDGYDIDDAFI